MDTVELALSTVVTVSNFMGSEGFVGCGGVKLEVKVRESELVGSNIDSCSSLHRQKASFKKMPDADPCSHGSQLSSFHGESMLDSDMGSASRSILLISKPDAKRKSVKVARSNSGSKRSRMSNVEVSDSGTVADNNLSNEIASHHAKSSITEKPQIDKQKNGLNGKRNGKVLKSKCDPFSLKAGLVSFSSAAGGNGIVGLYGSKPDACDITNCVDELSLNDLLDGSYKCPILGKDKGEKTANTSESIIRSVREACSVLQPRKPKQAQNFADFDDAQKVSTCPLGSSSSVEVRNDNDTGDTFPADLSSCSKDPCSNPKTPVNVLDFPLYQPQYVLERLSLPPPKDLGSLLMDAAKPSISSRNHSDLRAGKAFLQRGLPPFSWSHTSGGHCKSNSDAVKLSTSRSACPGRWVRAENLVTSQRGTKNFLADLELLTYDHSLVPLGGEQLRPVVNEEPPSTSASFISQEWGLLAKATCSTVVEAACSPRELAAAQTLCSLNETPRRMMTWTRKPSQRVVKACNLKSNENAKKVFSELKPGIGPDNLVKVVNEMLPSKKLKMSVNEASADALRNISSMKKTPLAWSANRSGRSSPLKSSLKDMIAGKPHHVTGVVNKHCYSEQKSRKLQMEWNRVDG